MKRNILPNLLATLRFARDLYRARSRGYEIDCFTRTLDGATILLATWKPITEPEADTSDPFTN